MSRRYIAARTPGERKLFGLGPHAKILDIEASKWLHARGQHWEQRLANEFKLTYPPSKQGKYTYRAVYCLNWRNDAAYGLCSPRTREIWVNAWLFRLGEWGPQAVDFMLVHEMIHATEPKERDPHGPIFKRRYSSVYPFTKPGVVTEFDPGTRRQTMWRKLNREIPREKIQLVPRDVWEEATTRLPGEKISLS